MTVQNDTINCLQRWTCPHNNHTHTQLVNGITRDIIYQSIARIETYVRTYVCMHLCMYVRMYVRTYVCMYVCRYVLGLCDNLDKSIIEIKSSLS